MLQFQVLRRYKKLYLIQTKPWSKRLGDSDSSKAGYLLFNAPDRNMRYRADISRVNRLVLYNHLHTFPDPRHAIRILPQISKNSSANMASSGAPEHDVVKKPRACVPCHERKVKCDASPAGIPCSRCIECGRLGQCRLVPLPGRATL